MQVGEAVEPPRVKNHKPGHQASALLSSLHCIPLPSVLYSQLNLHCTYFILSAHCTTLSMLPTVFHIAKCTVLGVLVALIVLIDYLLHILPILLSTVHSWEPSSLHTHISSTSYCTYFRQVAPLSTFIVLQVYCTHFIDLLHFALHFGDFSGIKIYKKKGRPLI